MLFPVCGSPKRRICFEGVERDFETESRIEDHRSCVGETGLEAACVIFFRAPLYGRIQQLSALFSALDSSTNNVSHKSPTSSCSHHSKIQCRRRWSSSDAHTSGVDDRG